MRRDPSSKLKRMVRAMKAEEWDEIWLKSRLPEVNRSLLEQLRKYAGDIVLEVGCGTATYSVALALGRQVIGVDFSLKALKTAKQRIRKAKVAVNLVRGSVYNLPFRDQAFHFAFSEGLLEHLTDEGAAITEMKRIIKHGGHILTVVPNRISPFYFIWRHFLTIKDEWIWGNERTYLPWSLSKLLQKQRLSQQSLFYFSMSWMLKFIDYPWNPLGTRIAVVVKKD